MNTNPWNHSAVSQPGALTTDRRVPPPARRAAPADGQAFAVTPQLVLYTLKRWWKIAFPLGLACAAVLAAAVWLTFEPKYQATALLRILDSPQSLLIDGSARGGRDGGSVETYLRLISSPMVMYGLDDVGPEGVVDQLLTGQLTDWKRADVPDLPPDQQRDRWLLSQWLTKQIRVQREGQSELYTVSFASVSPTFARAVLTEVLRSYEAVLVDQTRRQSSQIISLLDQTTRNRAEDLKLDERELYKLAQDSPGGSRLLDPQRDGASPALAALATVQTNLISAEVELELLRARLEAATASQTAPPDDDQPSPESAAPLGGVPLEVYSHPRIAQQMEYIQLLRGNLAQAEDVLLDGANSPDSQKRRTQIEHEERQLEAAIRSQVAEYRHVQILSLQAEFDAKQQEVQLLKQRYDDLAKQAGQGNRSNLELELKVMDLERKRGLINRLAERVELLRVEQGAPDAVVVLQPPDEPTRPEALYPTKQLAMAVPGGFAVPFLLFLAWELLARRVFNADRLERDLELTIFGEIAKLPNYRRRVTAGSGRKFDRSLQTFRESFDTLSTNLAMSLDLQTVRVFAVASAVSSEGKTSVAAELARRLAENTHAKVLLIDADMRSPDIHRLFQIESEPGLVDVLSGELTLEEAIDTSWSERLHILPAGRLAGSPVALLGNGNLRSLLDRAAEQYRFVVFDTPPILPAGEALMLTKAADVTLLCVMWESSRTDHVRRAYKRLALAGAQQVGLVINGVPTREYHRRYGHYGYSTQVGR